jgi:hypothetical protein
MDFLDKKKAEKAVSSIVESLATWIFFRIFTEN